ncbi:MAG: PRC-barrel domain-containing protein [Beijerinckiaceae bacterium]
METPQSAHSLISSNRIHGTGVFSTTGKSIGSVDHLVVDKVSGRIFYVVISFGGFLGLGKNHYPLPWSALRYDTSLMGYVTEVTEDQLRNAPEFSDDVWRDRDWETRLHRHYGARTYWGLM